MSELEAWFKSFDEYLTAVRGYSRASSVMYIRHVRRLNSWLAARGDELTSASESDIEAFMKSLFFDSALKNSSRANVLSGVKSFYAWLVHEKVLSGSPAEKVPSPKFQKPSARKFTAEELRLILSGPNVSTVRGVRDRAVLMLLYGSGPRVSEVSGLTLGSLSFTAKTTVVKFVGKGAKQRTLKLTAAPTVALFEWYAVRLAAGAGPSDPLFVPLIGKNYRHGEQALGNKGINAVLKLYARLVGIVDVEAFVHKMRATFAADLYDITKDILVVGAKMGHDDVTTTQGYIEISETALNGAVIPNTRWKELMRGGESGRQ